MNVTVLSSVILFILILVGCRVVVMSMKAGDSIEVFSTSQELTELLQSNKDLKERINNLELIITNIDETELKLQAIKLSSEKKI